MRELLVLLAAAAVARLPIDGTWAADLRDCSRPQESPAAPLVIEGRSMRQHEAACRLGALRPAKGDRSTAHGSCTVEGDVQAGAFSFRRRGSLLEIREPGAMAARVLKRCPARAPRARGA